MVKEKTMYKLKPRLGAYLRSYGNRLPTDFHKYRGTRDCVFCASPDCTFPVLVYVRRGDVHRYRVTGVYACDSCSEEISIMESSEILCANNPREDMFIEETLNRNTRIQYYIDGNIFDETVELHYHHFDYERAPFKHLCYFCKESCDMEGHVNIKVPVSASSEQSEIVGGEVNCCLSCHTQIEQMGMEDDESPMTKAYNVMCHSCANIYRVSTIENEIRLIDGNSLEDYLCPACAIDQVPRLMACLTFKDYFPYARYHKSYCQFCSDELVMDMMRPYDELIRDYVNSTNGLPVCLHCVHPEVPYKRPTVGRMLSGRHLLLVFELTYRRYQFMVFSISSVGRRTVISNHVYSGDLLDLMTDFFTQEEPYYKNLDIGPKLTL